MILVQPDQSLAAGQITRKAFVLLALYLIFNPQIQGGQTADQPTVHTFCLPFLPIPCPQTVIFYSGRTLFLCFTLSFYYGFLTQSSESFLKFCIYYGKQPFRGMPWQPVLLILLQKT